MKRTAQQIERDAQCEAMQLAVNIMHQRYADDVEHITMYGDDDELHGFHLTHWQGLNVDGKSIVRNIYSFTNDYARKW